MRLVPPLSVFIAAMVVVPMTGCGDASGPKPGPAASVVLVSGDALGTSEVGSKVRQPLTIKVSDSLGRRVSGIAVAWNTTSGTLSVASSVTDANGAATVEWTLGSIAGNQSATATVTSLKPVTFTAVAIAGPPTQMLLSRDTVRLLGIGDAFRLNARPADKFGNVVLIATTVESADTSIVTADNFGTGAILVAHASDRMTTIRAISGTFEKTGTVIVLPPPCQAGSGAFNLEVGELALLSGAAASEFCVQGTASGAEFIAVPFFSDFAGSSLRLSISTGNTTIGASPNRLAPLVQRQAPSARLRKDEAFEMALRERSLRDLTPLISQARIAKRETEGRFNLSVAVPQVGDLMNINTNSSSTCTNPNVRTGRIVAISNRAIIVSDTANPANGFTLPDYEYFGSAFDTLVYPVDTLNFGDPTDIDNNQHVILFFTRAVNELTPPSQSFYVGGFFYSRDLFPKTTDGSLQACAASNFAELFYLLAPDPEGIINQNVRTVEFVRTVSVGTLAHEFQHIINASRHLYVNASSTFEDTFLDEGLAHEAEELTFYRASGLAPGQNITYPLIQSSQKTQTAFDNFGSANFRRFREFLTNPLITSPYGNNANITTRGAIWSFLRYAADRRGESESQLWFQLANPPSGIHGLANLTRAITPDLSAWIRDWTVTTYADDFVPGAQPIDLNPSWNIRSMVSAVNDGTWPLLTQQLGATGVTSINIVDGSAAYLRFGVAAGAIGGGRIVSRAAPVPAGFALSILRTK
ncbi:MAG TPA: Ig-like domain-containing protein [Gemmatimonadaceae bacterium]|nr:Ig-like domain-containing protein [Gemmatimonadaceae bacterium]